MITRSGGRIIVLLLAFTLILAPSLPHKIAGQYLTPSYGEAGACAFLNSLYNPQLELLAETPGNRTYYVNSNLVAGEALSYGLCQQQTGFIGLQISSEVYLSSCCNHGYDNMSEILLQHRISLPIHDKTLHNVTGNWIDPAGNYTVYYQNHNATTILNNTRYGDIAAYSAMELESLYPSKALQEISTLNSMYDGTGIRDYPYTNGGPGELGVYQTSKLALYILALKMTSQLIPLGLEQQILSMQSVLDGGFYAGYNSNSAHIGRENVETTSIAMLALRAISGARVTMVDYTINMTGSQFQSATVRFESRENWTRDFEGRACFDATCLDNKTLPGVFPGHLETMSFTQDIGFNPASCHSVTILVGGTTITDSVYCPWWVQYWYLLIPIVAIPAATALLLYRRARTRGHIAS